MQCPRQIKNPLRNSETHCDIPKFCKYWNRTILIVAQHLWNKTETDTSDLTKLGFDIFISFIEKFKKKIYLPPLDSQMNNYVETAYQNLWLTNGWFITISSNLFGNWDSYNHFKALKKSKSYWFKKWKIANNITQTRFFLQNCK